MSQVITFDGYTPTPRYDDLPWTLARIEEAATSTGTWATIDTIALDPVDADPTTPASRDLTTELASSTPALWYRIIFVDASGDVSQPTDAVQNTGPATSLYVTRDELKTLLGLQNESFADEAIDVAVESAARACDGYKATRFYSSAETRYFSPGYYETDIEINDLVSVTAVTVDMDGDGTFELTWTEGTQFILDPPNAALDGRPFNRLVLRRPQNAARFPGYRNAVKIEGTFGWPAVPTLVKQATILLANRLLKRTESAPLGVLVANAADAVTMARLGRVDPDVAFLLDQIPGARQPALASLKLG